MLTDVNKIFKSIVKRNDSLWATLFHRGIHKYNGVVNMLYTALSTGPFNVAVPIRTNFSNTCATPCQGQVSYAPNNRCRLLWSSRIFESVLTSSSTFRQACITVVWSRPPKRSPIWGRLRLVNSLAKDIANCRGRAISLVRFFESKSETLIL